MPQRTSKNEARRRRSDVYLQLYLGLGPERSIRKLVAFCGSRAVVSVFPDLKASKRTIEMYSRDFGWTELAQRYDAAAADETEQVLITDAISSRARSSQIAKLLTEAGATSIEQRMGEDGEGLSDASAVRAIEAGFKMSRLLDGETTEIHGFMVSTYNVLQREMAGYWKQSLEAAVEGLDEPDRQRRLNIAAGIFATAMNDITTSHFRALGIDDLQLVGE